MNCHYNFEVSNRTGRDELSRLGAAAIAAVVAAATGVLDIGTKRWAVASFPRHHVTPVLGPWIGIRVTPAVAYALLGSTQLAYVFIAAVVVGLVLLMVYGAVKYRWLAIGVGLLIGAAASTLLGYLGSGEVTDFISVHTQRHEFFDTNFASIAVAIGLIILLWAIGNGSFLPNPPNPRKLKWAVRQRRNRRPRRPAH